MHTRLVLLLSYFKKDSLNEWFVCCYVREELHLKLIIKDSALFESLRCLLIAFFFLRKGWSSSAGLDYGEWKNSKYELQSSYLLVTIEI